MAKNKVLEKYIGCSGYFNKQGYFVIVPNLKIYATSNNSDSPILTIVKSDDGYIYLSADMIHISRMENKFVKIPHKK